MSADFIARSSQSGLSFWRDGRARRLLLTILFAVCFVLGFSYHLMVWSTHEPAGTTLGVLYNMVVLLGCTALWLLFSDLFQQRTATPAKIFWTTLLLGLLFVGIGRLLTSIGSDVTAAVNPTGPLGFEYDTGVPLTLATVLKMNLLGLLEILFAFLLLLRFRHLVLFKRTKSSQRNWYLMLGSMVLASLFAFMKPPQSEPGPLLGIAMVPAFVLIIINAFRLSWIVYLSFKEKMACIGLSLLLLAMLVAGIGMEGTGGLLPGAYTYVAHYSYPLGIFASLAVVFGILYSVTSFLSLLFHLPTTSDFQQKAGEMAAMHSLTHLVGQVFDAEKLVSTIAASPVEAGSAHASWLAVADPQSGSLRPRIVATHNITAERVQELVDVGALYQDVLSRREPLLLEQALADHRVDARPGDGIGSLLGFPLVARDEVLGVLFATKEVSYGFEKDDVEALSVFAAQAALALDNARLFAEQIEKERLARELAIAREVQRKLLPQDVPHLEGITLAASSVSAQEVGGDYYDFIKLDDQQLAVIIADVSGKGTSAAFYMAGMQGIFRAVSRLARTPSTFLSYANEALTGSLEKNVFISVIYGMLDLQEEVFVLARAGHCPAATIRLNGEARFLRTQGLGLGLDRSGLFSQTLVEERISLQPGDVFVLYTDGVVESRDADGEEYGYERLMKALHKHRHEDAPDLHAALVADLNAFIGHDNYDDDMTLVVLKWHGIRVGAAAPAADASKEPAPMRKAALEQEVQPD